ncbi:MAG: flippase, partial [Candidatus Margulisbacteria bacterium]|nr:flippase [Candidatus Margulisiibacteriota bacterium]
MSATRSIAKNFSWLLVGSIISGTINFIANVYVARVLGAASFGLFRFAQSFLAYMLLAVDSGLSTLGALEIAKNKDNAYNVTTNILLLRVLIASVVFLLGSAVVVFVPMPWEMRALLLFSFIYVFYRAVNLDWAFQGLEKMGFTAIAKVSNALFFSLFIVVFVRSADDLLRVPLILSFSGLAVSLVFLVLFIYLFSGRRFPILSQARISQYFYDAIPLGAAAFLIQIYNNMDTIMLGFLSSAQVVGYYSSAYQVYYIVLAFYIVWQAAAIPVAGSKMNEDKHKAQVFLAKYLRLTMLAVIPAVIAVCIAAPIIIGLLYGSGYNEAIPALRWLIWTMIPCAIGYSYGVLLLIPSGDSKGFLLAVAGGALINIVLNFLLIPQYGYAGAAIATIAAETTVALIAIYLSKKIFYLPI